MHGKNEAPSDLLKVHTYEEFHKLVLVRMSTANNPQSCTAHASAIS